MPVLKATLKRESHDKYTKGRLTVDNGFACDTLELAWKFNFVGTSCIPVGTYQVIPRKSQKYGNHLHVTNVVGRSAILIHWGNYAGSVNPRTGTTDIRGCILVGKGYADLNADGLPEIVNSKVTFAELMKQCHNGFELTIK
jgi:hypothetical protein